RFGDAESRCETPHALADSHCTTLMKSDYSTTDRPLGTPSLEVHRRNAFRIVGLPTDIAPRSLNLHVDKLRMIEKLRGSLPPTNAPLPLTPPPTSDQLHDAIQRLREPRQRIAEEILWFWRSTPNDDA